MAKQKRFITYSKRFFIVLLIILLFVLGYVIYDVLKEQFRDDGQVSKEETTVVKPKTITFTNDYFSFTVPDSWVFVEKESSSSTFVYRSYRGNLIEQELNVYINSTSSVDTSAIRVIPVSLNETTRILATEDISDHCNKFSDVKIIRQPVRVNLLGTSMMCQLDGTNFLIVAGQKGGSEDLKFKSLSGKDLRVKIFYRYSAVPADSIHFTKLLNTFKIL